MENLVLIPLVDHHHRVVLLVCEGEAYFHEEVLVQIQDEVLRLCTHRMATEEVESNMDLPRHGVRWVVEDADVRCHKVAEFASSQGGLAQEVHELAVPVHHSGREQAEAARGYCCMGSGTLLRSRMDKERNYDENPSRHLRADVLG